MEQDQSRQSKSTKAIGVNQLAEFKMIQDHRILEKEEITSKLALTTEFEKIAKKRKQHGDRDLAKYVLNRG